jgi:hypothetical protein
MASRVASIRKVISFVVVCSGEAPAGPAFRRTSWRVLQPRRKIGWRGPSKLFLESGIMTLSPYKSLGQRQPVCLFRVQRGLSTASLRTPLEMPVIGKRRCSEQASQWRCTRYSHRENADVHEPGVCVVPLATMARFCVADTPLVVPLVPSSASCLTDCSAARSRQGFFHQHGIMPLVREIASVFTTLSGLSDTCRICA